MEHPVWVLDSRENYQLGIQKIKHLLKEAHTLGVMHIQALLVIILYILQALNRHSGYSVFSITLSDTTTSSSSGSTTSSTGSTSSTTGSSGSTTSSGGSTTSSSSSGSSSGSSTGSTTGSSVS